MVKEPAPNDIVVTTFDFSQFGFSNIIRPSVIYGRIFNNAAFPPRVGLHVCYAEMNIVDRVYHATFQIASEAIHDSDYVEDACLYYLKRALNNRQYYPTKP